MPRSSASVRGMARKFLEVQPVNGFHRDVESESTIRLNGAGHNYAHTPSGARHKAFSRIVYVSGAMDEVGARIECARGSEAPMLITGETGTGKDLIARAVHAISPRHEGEFIPFNCGGRTPELIANEL